MDKDQPLDDVKKHLDELEKIQTNLSGYLTEHLQPNRFANFSTQVQILGVYHPPAPQFKVQSETPQDHWWKLQIRVSQRRAYQKLKNTSPELIGIEQLHEESLAVFPETALEHQRKSATVLYAKRHKARYFGFEDSAPYTLCLNTMKTFNDLSWVGQPNRYNNLFVQIVSKIIALRDACSVINISKMIREYKPKDLSVVIGIAHLPNFRRLKTELNLNWEIFNLSDDSKESLL